MCVQKLPGLEKTNYQKSSFATKNRGRGGLREWSKIFIHNLSQIWVQSGQNKEYGCM